MFGMKFIEPNSNVRWPTRIRNTIAMCDMDFLRIFSENKVEKSV